MPINKSIEDELTMLSTRIRETKPSIKNVYKNPDEETQIAMRQDSPWATPERCAVLAKVYADFSKKYVQLNPNLNYFGVGIFSEEQAIFNVLLILLMTDSEVFDLVTGIKNVGVLLANRTLPINFLSNAYFLQKDEYLSYLQAKISTLSMTQADAPRVSAGAIHP